MPGADPRISADPRMLTAQRKMMQNRGYIRRGHHVPDRPPESIGDSRIIQPGMSAASELGKQGLNPFRMRSTHIQAEEMIWTFVNDSGHMRQEVWAWDRVILENHRVSCVLD